MTKIIYQLTLVLILAAIPAFSAEPTIDFDHSTIKSLERILEIKTNSDIATPDPVSPVEDNCSGLMKTGFRILNETGTWVPMTVETNETGKRYTTMPTMPNSQPEELEWWVSCPVPSNYLWHVCLKYKTNVSISGHEHSAPPLPITGNPPCVSNIPGGKKIYWYFKVPEYSGEITFTATASGACVGPVSDTLTVKVPGLANMPAGWGYELTGWTSAHPNNHYGKLNNITSLQNIAREYKTLFQDDHALNYNDMSLVWGGLFDIGPPYGIFWQTPHIEHRLGNHVDIGIVPVEHQPQLIEIMCKYAYAYLVEKTPPHYHLSFANSYSRDYKVEELPENSGHYKPLCPKK